jgi:hypothetical protein
VTLEAPQRGITVRVAQNVSLFGPFSRELLLFAAVSAPCELCNKTLLATIFDDWKSI